jgi:hypothetical protein
MRAIQTPQSIFLFINKTTFLFRKCVYTYFFRKRKVLFIEKFGEKTKIGVLLLMIVMLTGVQEKVLQIHLKNTVPVFLEANCLQERFVSLLGSVDRLVNTAKVNKIQCGAAHQKDGLKVLNAGHKSKIKDLTNLTGRAELADSDEFFVNRRGVGKRIGAIRNAATRAIQLLIGL